MKIKQLVRRRRHDKISIACRRSKHRSLYAAARARERDAY